ncbi:MAG: hypothetical protein JW892_01265 [Anaerolineae bacterium]|nr:hypothetical protein [Anaerolineae bacterium]
MFRRTMRETAFRLARRDLAQFLIDHEDRLMVIFRDELRKLDEEIPEENLFIDIHLVPLGEMILRAVLRALNRFLLMDDDASAMKGVQSEHTSTV